MTEATATVETFTRNLWGDKCYRGVLTKPWPPDSNRLGNIRVVCPHRHRTRQAAQKCADKAAPEGNWYG